MKTRPSAAGRAALLAAIPVLFFLAFCGRGGDGIIRVQDGAAVSFEELVGDLASVPLVFIGELHTSRGHHEAQLQIIRALADKGEKVAIGLEMFHDGHQEELDAWLSGGDYEGVDLDAIEGVMPTVTADGGAGVSYGFRF